MAWKVCLAEFSASFAGTLIFLLVSYLDLNDWWWKNLQYTVMWNHFSSIHGFIVTMLSISASAALIYFPEKRILPKIDFVPQEHVAKIVLLMAVFTAPYLVYSFYHSIRLILEGKNEGHRCLYAVFRS